MLQDGLNVTKSQPGKGSDPLEASHFHCVSGLAGEGQTPFRTGSKALDVKIIHDTLISHGKLKNR